jgi:hypothetical protein
LAFASERFILKRLLDDQALERWVGPLELAQIRAGNALAIHLDPRASKQGSIVPFALSREHKAQLNGAFSARESAHGKPSQVVDLTRRAANLRRCKLCILP